MAKIVKINDVRLYVGFTPNAAKCNEAMVTLQAANVPFTLMAYNDPAQHDGVFKAISTWTFGKDEAAKQVPVSDFPFVTWMELYDDYTHCPQIHVGHDLASSSLFVNKALVANT